MVSSTRSHRPLRSGLALLLPAALGAAPMAGTVVVRQGSLEIHRGGRVRSVSDFARLELGDAVRTAAGASADLSTFDSRRMVLHPEQAYSVERDGVYRQVPLGKLRAFQFLQPLSGGRDARDVVGLVGSLGILVPQGAVKVRRAGTRDWVEVPRETPLYYHDEVRTGPDGSASLDIPGRALVLLEDRSEVSFQNDFALLEQGVLTIHWRRAGRRFEVETPRGGMATSSRGVYRISSWSDLGDRVAAFQGSAQIWGRAEGRHRGLGDGELLQVSAAGAGLGGQRFSSGPEARRLARELREGLEKLGTRSDARAQQIEALQALARPADVAGMERGPAPEPPAPAWRPEGEDAAEDPPTFQDESDDLSIEPGFEDGPPMAQIPRGPRFEQPGWVPLEELAEADDAGGEPPPLAPPGSAPPTRAPPTRTPPTRTPKVSVPPDTLAAVPNVRRIAPGQGVVSENGWVVQVETSPPQRVVAAAPSPALQVAPRRQVPAPPPAQDRLQVPPRLQVPAPTRAVEPVRAPEPVRVTAPAPAPDRTPPPPPPRDTRNSTTDRAPAADPLGGPVRASGPSDLARIFRL